MPAPPGDSRENGAREAVVPAACGTRCGAGQGHCATPHVALGEGDRCGQRTCGHVLQCPSARGWGPVPLAEQRRCVAGSAGPVVVVTAEFPLGAHGLGSPWRLKSFRRGPHQEASSRS